MAAPQRDASAQSPTPVPAYVVGPSNAPAVTWRDYVQTVATVLGVVIATGGLGGVLYSLYQARRDQRTQSGPYLRIDVALRDGTEDFKPPKAHFANSLKVVDLAPDISESKKLTLSAWIRNYQSHPLGFALAISAFFVLETRRLGTEVDDAEAEYFLLEVPYVEYEKPVRVDLFKIPKDVSAFLWLASVSFYDFYDRRHEHQFGQRSSNALHGRLSCDYAPERVESIPEARPRGPKVEFQ